MAAALLPLGSFAQTPPQEWRVSVALESGAVSGRFACPYSGNGYLRVQDGVMSWHWEENGRPATSARWKITLSADGSFDASIKYLIDGKERTNRITVPAGSGPRMIRSVSQNGCRNRFEPS